MAITPTVDQISCVVELFTRYRNVSSFAAMPAQSMDRLGFRFEPETALSSGTTANKFDRVLAAFDIDLANAATLDLDLYDGTNWSQGEVTPSDPLGNVVQNLDCILLYIHNQADSAGNLIVGGKGDASTWLGPFNANTAKWTLKPGGVLLVFCPPDPAYAVGATAKILKLEASGGDVDFNALAWLRSA